MKYDYNLWGVKLNVGDIVVSCDGSGYRGKVNAINDGKVYHQCLRTGHIWIKSYEGFGIRYMKEGCPREKALTFVGPLPIIEHR